MLAETATSQKYFGHGPEERKAMLESLVPYGMKEAVIIRNTAQTEKEWLCNIICFPTCIGDILQSCVMPIL